VNEWTCEIGITVPSGLHPNFGLESEAVRRPDSLDQAVLPGLQAETQLGDI